MSSYHVYSHSSGHQMAHFFVFSPDDTKKSVKVWAKYLSVSERPYLPLLEKIMDYWVLSDH